MGNEEVFALVSCDDAHNNVSTRWDLNTKSEFVWNAINFIPIIILHNGFSIQFDTFLPKEHDVSFE